MEAAYGLAIVMCMISTSVLLVYFMFLKRVPKPIILLFAVVYGTIEISFFIANVEVPSWRLCFFVGGWGFVFGDGHLVFGQTFAKKLH